MSQCYELGHGVSKDLRQAAEWCKKAVDGGSRSARKDTARVNKKFFLQCLKAAERDEVYALRDLGLCYERGIGTTRDLLLAQEWYRKATENHLLNADDDLRRVEGLLAKADSMKSVPSVAPPPLKPSTPLLKITSFSLEGDCPTLQKMKFYSLILNVENTEDAIAEDVTVKLELPEGVMIEENSNDFFYSSIKGSESKILEYHFYIRNSYLPSIVPLKVTIQEKQGKYSENWSTELALGQNIHPKVSDVDEDIPLSNLQQPETYVLIISEENYRRVASVPYAVHDGEMFREYCIKALGVPEENILFEKDVTKSEIAHSLDALDFLAQTSKKEKKIIFYYAGHGVPDKQKSSRLLPIDGFSNDAETGIELEQLYEKLNDMAAKTNAQTVTVFLDACFSGSNREGGTLEENRGVVIQVNPPLAKGKIIVLSAASGDQPAYAYNDQKHGLFTYFLLKKLQQTSGDVTLGELAEYLTEEVGKTSIRVNKKIQTPEAKSSLTGWQNRKL